MEGRGLATILIFSDKEKILLDIICERSLTQRGKSAAITASFNSCTYIKFVEQIIKLKLKRNVH